MSGTKAVANERPELLIKVALINFMYSIRHAFIGSIIRKLGFTCLIAFLPFFSAKGAKK